MIINGEVWPDEVSYVRENGNHSIFTLSSDATGYEVNGKLIPLKEMLPKKTYINSYNKTFMIAMFHQTIEHILNGDI